MIDEKDLQVFYDACDEIESAFAALDESLRYLKVALGRLRSGTETEIGRDASTGQFITVEEAESRPETTVVEKIERD